MAAAQTKGHKEDKTYRDAGEKSKKRKTKNEKQEARHKNMQARKSYSRRLHSNKSSRLLLQSRDGDFA